MTIERGARRRDVGRMDMSAAGAIVALGATALAVSHVIAGKAVLENAAVGRFELATDIVFAAMTAGLFVVFLRLRRGALARAVSRLRETNHTLNALIDEAPLGIVSLDRRGNVLSLNPAGERILGWRSEELAGHSIPFIPPGRRRGFWRAQRGVLMRGEPIRDLEIPMRRKDGSEIATSFSSAPRRDSVGWITGSIGIFEDVTDRKRDEATRRRYLAFAESSQDIVLFARPDGRILDANRAAFLAYGYDRSDFLTLTHEDLCAGGCPPIDPNECLREVRYEASHRRRNGDVFPVEVDRTITVVDGETIVLYLVRDISQRRSREATRALLHDFDERILAGEELDTVLEFLCRQAAELHHLEVVQIALKVPDGSLEVRAAGGTASSFARLVPPRWDETPEGRGPTGTAVRTGEIAIVDVASDGGFEPWHAAAREAGLRVGMAVPLVSSKETVGALTVYASRVDVIHPETVATLRSFADQVVLLLLSARDREQIRRREEEVRFLALHDPLTKLPNRRSFEDSLDRAVSGATRGRDGAILLLDLDHFKVINDMSGHVGGDRLLVVVAEILRGILRPADFLSRLGGDEFAILIDDADIEAAGEVGERLRRAMDDFEFRANDRVFNVSASVGISPVDGTLNAEAVMALVDGALYAAKEEGRNRVVMYRRPEQMQLRLADDNQWARRVKDALRNRRFVLHFQPVVRLTNGRTEHLEALLRMRGESGFLVSPREFLTAAERFGLMPQVDRWVVEQVLSVFAADDRLRIFVNLSGASLGDRSFLEFVESRVRQAQLAPGRLVFEVTETAAVADLSSAQSWACRLKEMGCAFALDDFGTGFSSFRYLQAIPADFVKIDASFVRHLDTNSKNRALVRAITDVSHALGKEVIAEGVETAGALDVLKELSVEHGQGYYLGMPSASILGADGRPNPVLGGVLEPPARWLTPVAGSTAPA